MTTALPAPTLIASKKDLTPLVATLRQQPAIAVDTESNSLYAYQEQVCLIQFSVPSCDYIVDPLEVEDLEPLRAIFASPKIEKVFHAAEYDLISLHRDYGWDVQNIFDTMIAARTLGWRQIGLGSILNDEFGVRLNKRYQRANWGSRPLSPDQLAYARLDTHYLLALRERLTSDLRAQGRWEEASEEFDRVRRSSLRSAVESRSNGINPDAFWRITGARELNGRQAAILRELYIYRERMAADWNRPAFKIIGDETILAIAHLNPRVLQQLESVNGMTPGQVRRHGRQLLEAVKRGRRASAPHPPEAQRVDEEVVQRYEALHRWRKARARKRGVESDVILAREVLWDLARHNPTTLAELDAIPDLGPWRRARYGEEILTVLQENA